MVPRYVIRTATGKFVNLDDGPGPMSSGYPYEVDNIWEARTFLLSGRAYDLTKYFPGSVVLPVTLTVITE